LEATCDTKKDEAYNSPEELARESIKDAEEYVQRLSEAVFEAGSLYRTGETDSANKIYGQCVDGFNWFLSLIVSIEQLFQVDYAALFNSDWESCDYKVAFPLLFTKIIECQRKEDWTDMADILEYEVNPLLKKWSSAVSKVKI